ncbi:MAG: HAD-IIB family hydrolase [Candidatus Pacebacteria bacterium]|jgi:hypothetical protein|nr:HAD-IIB family hydrolase [Candidatus Paceibacterota bacterium]
MKKHFFFDMDGTLTRSRSEITDTMVACLRGLIENGGDVIVVSGAVKSQIIKQIGEIVKDVVILAQNGNHAESSSGEIVWRNELTAIQKNETLKLARKMIGHANLGIRDPGDLVEDRMCQISYSLIGHNAPLEEKEAIDSEKIIRKGLLCCFEKEISQLNILGIQARIGGTTCIDFTALNKGDNVKCFIERMGWDPEECIYIGDALFEGGNDHSVVGVVPTYSVDSPRGCEDVIRSFINELGA